MDPFAALGAASAVASFVQMSYSLISSACDTYKSVSGMPKEDEQLGFVVRELSRLAESMISTKPTLDQSDAERAMDKVASRCSSFSNKLLEILSRSQTRDLHSLRRSAIAALRSKWNEKEKAELKKQADECRELLHLQLSVMIGCIFFVCSNVTTQLTLLSRTDTVRALQKLARTGMTNASELASLRRHISLLERGVTLSSIGEEAVDQLAGLLKLSHSALDSITAHRILSSLSFPEMHRRYGSVSKTHSETFQWIFEDEPDKKPKALEGKTLFTNWLMYGDGVFHIAGKPGAGKSTLMRFVYKSKETRNLLGTWAAGRKLVMGKFFFWKPGGDMENSTTALLRTLVYDVLQQCPDLVPHVFPKQWDQVRDLPWQTQVELLLDGDEIGAAFDRLVENRNLYEERCFFYMIDGLDEFHETRDEGYKQLIQLVFSWTAEAPLEFKLCVSSRELGVFLDRFSGPQGLRLQDLTEGDIIKYVKERLEANQNFVDMKKPQGGADKLVGQVTQRASGVFLWVALVVKLLDDACDDDDTYEELQRKVEQTQPEIEKLFRQLFDSIHESDRDQSAQTIAVVLKGLAGQWGLRLSLFRYSLLDDYNADPFLASKPDWLSQDQPTGDEKASEARLKRARKQLYKRCKGLLEVIESDHDPLYLTAGDDVPGWHLRSTPLRQRISLAHRSVQEFLEREDIARERTARINGFDTVGAICQTYVAELVAVYSKEPDRSDFCYGPELMDIFDELLNIEPGAVQGKWISALHNLDKARSRYRKEGLGELNFCCLPSGPYMPAVGRGREFSVAHCAASLGFLEYFTAWDHSLACPLDDDIRNGSLVLAAIYGQKDASDKDGTASRLAAILRWLFRRGCSPNQAFQGSGNRNGSLWWAFLSVTAAMEEGNFAKQSVAESAQIFLEFGANPNFSFSGGCGSRHQSLLDPRP